jgi:ketosteroid isomerase-like protein
MGRARELWEALSSALGKQDVEALLDLYAPDGVYLEPQNPPHEGNLLIQAYLNSWLQARSDVEVSAIRLLESDDGVTLAIEWNLSYAAGGRRWTLPRSTWLEADDAGIRYHRDYY